ncbi:hypothetical protein PMY38_11885 [Clostridium tertium]|uniref:phage tail tube protein n=1 Tax=Clostridium tertium TaxID=1559 RepID=UPI000C0855D6|nr:hypothetical protein [Clostridium tertium]MBS6503473.1 hypothetical protein [Clostridium sp.]MDB1956863.1 hypothetical protein [Clostridium tertium]MDB1959301.1 hypothetical protein [Clostridium tertium]MDB1963204.1 hypothetical protein [Clostridium tertium]MDB1967882.1 hypothetical protein [Clostridium tertium]
MAGGSFSGVFPVYNLKFKIGTRGKASETGDMAVIADMETFSISIDGTVEEWTPMDTSGWARALMTGKKFSVGLNGKRNVGDKGNDYVAATAWKDGLDCSTKGEIEFPDGAKLTYDCVINVKNIGGGDSTNVAPLEFDMQSDGKPTYTPAPGDS